MDEHSAHHGRCLQLGWCREAEWEGVRSMVQASDVARVEGQGAPAQEAEQLAGGGGVGYGPVADCRRGEHRGQGKAAPEQWKEALVAERGKQRG